MLFSKKIIIIISIIVIFVFISCFSVSRTDEGEIISADFISGDELLIIPPEPPEPEEEVLPSVPEIQEDPTPPPEQNEGTFVSVAAGYSEAIEGLEVSVPEEQYISDKEHIMDIIQQLDAIMKNKSYQSWVSYLSPDSLRYWSNTANLKRASLRLPIKGIELKSLRDYFYFIFLPSRQGRQIDQIKYLTPDLVKAVQTINGRDIVFYHFEKIDTEWKIQLDQLDN
jgi:hypothetical protein